MRLFSNIDIHDLDTAACFYCTASRLQCGCRSSDSFGGDGILWA
jgi:hypothetical protein